MCVGVCIKSYSLLGDYIYGRILKVLFVEMHVNVAFVKLVVQLSEFNWCWRIALYKNYLLLLSHTLHQYTFDVRLALLIPFGEFKLPLVGIHQHSWTRTG